MTVTLNNRPVDFEVATNLMDDEIREELHAQGIDSEQAFMDAYVAAHAAKFNGEEFTV